MSNVEKVKESLNITDEMLTHLTEGLSTREGLFGRDGLFRQLQKAVPEKMLNKEMDFHLSSEKQSFQPGNYRNGKGHKTVKSESGKIPPGTETEPSSR
jgi:putative transposase